MLEKLFLCTDFFSDFKRNKSRALDNLQDCSYSNRRKIREGGCFLEEDPCPFDFLHNIP